MAMSKEMIWGAYAVLMVVLGVIGYFVGKKQNKAEIYASTGIVLGAIISVILWITVGKKMTEK